MSLLNNRSNVLIEKDYREQLIFSNKLPETSKNKLYFVVIGVLFSLFFVNIVNAMSTNPVIDKIF